MGKLLTDILLVVSLFVVSAPITFAQTVAPRQHESSGSMELRCASWLRGLAAERRGSRL